MSSLEDARIKAAEMFEQGNDSIGESAPGDDVQADNPAGEVTAESVPAPEVTSESVPASMTEEALATAEVAAQAAQQRDTELAEVTEKLGEISRQNEELKSTIEQMSRQQEETIVNDMLEPPVLNAEQVLYGDAESQSKALADYQQKVNEYNKAILRREMEEELKPLMEFAREGMAMKEKAEALKAIKETVPELSDIDSKAPVLDAIIEQNPFLSASDKPMEEKYIMAYMLSRGLDAVKNPPVPPEPPKAPTAQELMEYAKNNKEFAEMLAMEKIAAVQSGQQVPPFSASSGAVNAAPTIQNTPTNLDEAKEQFKKMFRA